MKRKTLYTSILILLGVVLLSSPGFSAEPQSEQAKQLTSLVDKAAALIESKGTDAFPEFKKKDSEWYKGDTYIFVSDMKGTMLMHPVKAELEGKNQMDLKDVNGKLFVQEMINAAKTQGSGWVDYMWPKPGSDKPAKKSSYVKMAKMPNGETVFVGAGMYTD